MTLECPGCLPAQIIEMSKHVSHQYFRSVQMHTFTSKLLTRGIIPHTIFKIHAHMESFTGWNTEVQVCIHMLYMSPSSIHTHVQLSIINLSPIFIGVCRPQNSLWVYSTWNNLLPWMIHYCVSLLFLILFLIHGICIILGTVSLFRMHVQALDEGWRFIHILHISSMPMSVNIFITLVIKDWFTDCWLLYIFSKYL